MAASRQLDNGRVAYVEELPGTSTRGTIPEEARGNLAEAVQLVLEANRHTARDEFGQGEVDGWQIN